MARAAAEAASRAKSEEIERRRLVEAELQLQATVVRNMDEGVCLVRTDTGQVVYANPRFEEMFGYGPGEMVGLPKAALNYDDGSGLAERRANEILAEAERSGTAEYEVENVTPRRSPLPLSRPRIPDRPCDLRSSRGRRSTGHLGAQAGGRGAPTE